MCFSTFSATSGLKVNAAKSEVFFRGVPESVKTDILQISCFREGDLPFKYLGIPIQTGRLTKMDCNILIERVVARIRSIGARKLSYAGRLTLVNAVLNTLHNYWGSIFLIPKAVVRRIEAICRSYFWDGGSEYQRAPLIAWIRSICRKEDGGLGVIKAENWNIASVGKLVNWIYSNADRLWVQWVHHIYLKDQDWHTYVPPADSNWNWRNIYKVKGLISSGEDTPLVGWYKDVWDGWCIPKHSIICWLIKHEALNTREKLFRLQISDSSQCVICEDGIETHEHLFSRCKYSEQIKDQLESWLQIQIDPQGLGLSVLQQRVCRVALAAFWYYVGLKGMLAGGIIVLNALLGWCRKL
ncbi:uncharacterized protein LOC141651630 [Silene latifolia]|uniref:uncharacterized protein LOC141651630 n=1 Tax=Silene latifolia TaxID=37657 RepID=UPI003D771F6C